MATISIKLGGASYVVPPLSMGQVRRACEFASEGMIEVFGFLQVALERAEPKPDFEKIPFDLDEVTTAVGSIKQFCGLGPTKASHSLGRSADWLTG